MAKAKGHNRGNSRKVLCGGKRGTCRLVIHIQLNGFEGTRPPVRWYILQVSLSNGFETERYLCPFYLYTFGSQFFFSFILKVLYLSFLWGIVGILINKMFILKQN